MTFHFRDTPISHSIPHNTQGFSLIELLVVLMILGMLGGLVGPRLFSKVDSSRVDTAQTQVKMLKAALQVYRLDMGRLPTTEEGLKAPTSIPANSKRWRGPYLDDLMPLDPWDNPYVYLFGVDNFQGYALYSRGADAVDGGEASNADVGILP